MATVPPTGAPTPGSHYASSQWKNDLVVADSVLGSIAAVLCVQVLIVLTQNYRLSILHDRLIIGVFSHSFVFSIVVAVPFDYNDSAGYTNADYCWWRGLWFASSYGVLMYINFILCAVLYVLTTGKEPKFKLEMTGHAVCLAVVIACLGGFVGHCYEIYAGVLNEVDDDDDGGSRGERIVDESFFPAMQAWIILVFLALLMWMWSARYTTVLERLWSKHLDSLNYLEDDSLRDDALETGGVTLERYAWIIRPLRLYPIVFLIFGLPAVVFFTDSCYDRPKCLRSVEFFLNFRTFAIYLSFLYSSPRNLMEAKSVHIILAKRLGLSSTKINRDDAGHYGLKRGKLDAECFEGEEYDVALHDRLASIEYNAFRDDNNLLRHDSVSASPSWSKPQPRRESLASEGSVRSGGYVFVEGAVDEGK
mmetsp:Transcript_20494/g.61231  ORF Transcript_20494/g.61231 Transcript_20494/m.61231 type:complete len:420 (+) Transcript_20494:486-1745(+)